MSSMTDEDLMWAWLREGWKFRLRQDPGLKNLPVAERVKHEMDVIVPKGYASYFLIVSDLLRWAKSQGIAIGPGRGSAAGSLCCYLLRITEINPLYHNNMLFSRFLDPNREDPPDVDIDIQDDRRDELKTYLKQKYGDAHVADLGAFQRFRGKTSVQDIGRVYTIPKDVTDELKGFVEDRPAGDERENNSLEDAFDTFPRAAEILEEHPEFQYASMLEGNYRGLGKHAAGVIVSTVPLSDIVATYLRDGLSVVSVDKKDAEYLGLLKLDLLGLKTMTMLSKALGFIGMKLTDLYSIPLDDQETLEAFQRADVTGVFQFEGRTTADICKRVKPVTFGELADINALSRPGAMMSGATDSYIKRQAQSFGPVFDSITTETRGQIVFQEQLMRLATEFAGMTDKEAAHLRRMINKKSAISEWNKLKDRFVDGAVETAGVSRKKADKAWAFVVASAGYGFNYAHAACYAAIGYWAMWIKVHHPEAFYVAQLSVVADDKWPELLKDARKHGFKVSGPTLDLNPTWSASEGVIIAGLTQIKGIGDRMAEKVILHFEEAGAKPTSWDELADVPGIGVKKVKQIKEFAESDDPMRLDYAKNVLTTLRKVASSKMGIPPIEGLQGEGLACVWAGLVSDIRYGDAVETKRKKTGMSRAEILSDMTRPHLTQNARVKAYDEHEEVFLSVNRFMFPKFEEDLKNIVKDETPVIIVGKQGVGFGKSIMVEKLWVVRGS